MHDADLLEQIPLGGLFWFVARGRSMWPLVLDGDRLCVERTTSFELGDVVVRRSGNALLAHIATQLTPLETQATNGVIDRDAGPVLARVTKLRRGALAVSMSPLLRNVFHSVPRAAPRLKRIPGLPSLVRAWRDAKVR